MRLRWVRSSIENAAQRRDLHRQIGFLDRGAAPDRSHDGVFRHDIAVARDQQPQQIKGARAEQHRFVAARGIEPEQTAGLEPKTVKQKAAIETTPVHGRLRGRQCRDASTII